MRPRTLHKILACIDSNMEWSSVILAVALISAAAAVGASLLGNSGQDHHLHQTRAIQILWYQGHWPLWYRRNNLISLLWAATPVEESTHTVLTFNICPCHLIVKFWKMEFLYIVLAYLLCTEYFHDSVRHMCCNFRICNGFCTCLKVFSPGCI